MSNLISGSPSFDFESAVKEKLKESIAGLLSDADMKRLMEAGISEFFFQPRHDRWGQKLPSLMEHMVKEFIQQQFNEVAREWLVENKHLVEPMVKQVVQEGAGTALMRGLTLAFSSSMASLEQNITERILTRS